jgi:hypothetical protein
MEESASVCSCGLSSYGEFSETGDLWINVAVSEGGYLNPANFAEGFKKTGKADKLRFYNIAQGSLEECRYYLILARDLGYGDSTELSMQLEEVSKMLGSYMQRIRNDV